MISRLMEEHGDEHKLAEINRPTHDLAACLSKECGEGVLRGDRYLADIFYGVEGIYLNQQLIDKGLAVGYKE